MNQSIITSVEAPIQLIITDAGYRPQRDTDTIHREAVEFARGLRSVLMLPPGVQVTVVE